MILENVFKLLAQKRVTKIISFYQIRISIDEENFNIFHDFSFFFSFSLA